MEKKEGLKLAQFYFEKVRKQLLKVLFIFLGGGILGAIFYQDIIRLLFSFFPFYSASLVLTSPGQAVNLILSISFLSGLLVSFPFLIFLFLKFIKPALTAKEYSLLSSLALPSFFFLLLGLAYGAYTMRFVASFYAHVSLGISVVRFWDIGQFFSQMIFLAAVLGILFQLPIFITVILHLKIISLETLMKKRKAVWAGLLILVVLLPPTDPLSLLILVLPLLLMFEGVLLWNRKGGDGGV